MIADDVLKTAIDYNEETARTRNRVRGPWPSPSTQT